MVVLEDAGYRAVSRYTSLAHQEHIEAGHATTEQLARFIDKARASVTRGLGPPARAGVSDQMELKSKLGSLRAMPGGPANPELAIPGATWPLMREIEAAASTMKQVSLEQDGKVLRIRFGPTKVD